MVTTEEVVDDVLAANPYRALQAKKKPQMIGWFVGQVMLESEGKANPKEAIGLLKDKLGI